MCMHVLVILHVHACVGYLACACMCWLSCMCMHVLVILHVHACVGYLACVELCGRRGLVVCFMIDSFIICDITHVDI